MKWTPPPINGPRKRKTHPVTAYQAYCKSDEAPKGGDYVTTEGRPRCDIMALQDACKAAWALLSDDEKLHYLDVAKDLEAAKQAEREDNDAGVQETEVCAVVA